MIQTCKYCASQKRSCDECGEPVISRTITEFLPEEPHSIYATFLLCTNLNCGEYGKFNQEHAEDNKSFVCSKLECQAQQAILDSF